MDYVKTQYMDKAQRGYSEYFVKEKKVLEELGVGCQWPIGAIARVNEKEFSINSCARYAP